MSRAEDQAWSPFPVQDWSRLPDDPLAHSTVDPSWGPPAPPRRWWIPLVVLAVIGALVGGATFAGSTVGLDPPQTPATAFPTSAEIGNGVMRVRTSLQNSITPSLHHRPNE